MTAADRPTRWYRGSDRRTRAHVAVRWATCPFGALEALVPRSGDILDWGCGHGLLTLWLAESGPARTVVGIDVDAAKIDRARAAAAMASPFADRVRFEVGASDARPAGAWDAIVISDVLYLVDPAAQRDLVDAAVAALAPGGVLVIKETGEAPRWKVRLSRAQEQFAVRVARLTATESGIHPPPTPQELATWLEGAGLAVTIQRLDRGYHTPHVAVVGEKGAESETAQPGGRLPF